MAEWWTPPHAAAVDASLTELFHRHLTAKKPDRATSCRIVSIAMTLSLSHRFARMPWPVIPLSGLIAAGLAYVALGQWGDANMHETVLGALVVGLVASSIVGALIRRGISAETLRIRTAINHLSQGLCMFDAAQRLAFCNEQYLRMYGLSPKQVKPGIFLSEIMALRRLVHRRRRRLSARAGCRNRRRQDAQQRSGAGGRTAGGDAQPAAAGWRLGLDP